MKKTRVWGSFVNGGDGSVSIRWFLKEVHAQRDQDNMDEGWGETCMEMIETYEGSECHKEAVKNSKELDSKHEYLREEDHYESKDVISSKTYKKCEHCDKEIRIGGPSVTHTFHNGGEFVSYHTHVKCEDEFMESLND